MSASSDDIGSLLQARAAGSDASDIGSLLSQRAQGGLAAATPAPTAPVTTGQRFTQGLTDLPVGLGQIAEHVAETPLNGVRTAIRGALNAVGAPDVASLFSPVSTSDFDNIVGQREKDYQQARTAAQQSGIDWWRLGGQVANPLNYLAPGAAAETVAGRIGAGAAQGAAIGAAQPSTTPGSFWWDKAKGAITGAATGGIIGSAIEGAMPLIKVGVNSAKKALGSNAAATPAADAVVNSALNAKGVDPASVDINVLSALKKDAQDALAHNQNPSPEMIALRAKAESLPYPVPLLKGQLAGNEPGGAIQFAKEQNLRGIEGVGEPITQTLTNQNAAFINNLDALGAKTALDPVELGQQLSPKVQGFWDQLQAKKDALYSAVRNAQGQPAAVDGFTAAQNIRAALDTPQASHAYDLLPANIKRTVDDLQDGKLPLTVAQTQSLDKMWGGAQRGADGSTAYAIGVARRELANAPVADDVGQQANAAYQAAKAAHAQQMSLVEPKLPNGMPNPQYQPLLDSVVYGGKPPETLFDTHFMGAAPSVAAKNLAFISKIDPTMPQQIGQTYMGEIKRMALSGASDERGTVSNGTISRFLSPVNSARMDALLPAPAAQTYRNLADVVEAAKRLPTASAVNTSNSGSAVVNAAASALKGGLLEKATGVLGKVPVVGPLLNAKSIGEGLKQSRLQTEVQGATNPGVTLKSLLSTTPSQAARRGLAGRAAIPAAVAASSQSNNED